MRPCISAPPTDLSSSQLTKHALQYTLRPLENVKDFIHVQYKKDNSLIKKDNFTIGFQFENRFSLDNDTHSYVSFILLSMGVGLRFY